MINENERILKCSKCKQELFVPNGMIYDQVVSCCRCGKNIKNKYYKNKPSSKFGARGYLILSIVLILLYLVYNYGQSRKQKITKKNKQTETLKYDNNNTYLSNIVSEKSSIDNIEYSVSVNHRIDNLKLVLNVMLHDRVNDVQFENLAYTIKEKYGENSDNLYIAYYLKGMQKNLGAYAISHFNPNPQINKFGFSDEEIIKLKNQLNNEFPNYKIVGKWTEEPLKLAIFIYSNNNQYKIIKTDLSGDYILVETLIKKTVKGKRFYIVNDLENTYYLLEPNMQLSQWDNDGIIINLLNIVSN